MADFKWNDERRLAAQLLADGNLTDVEIADRAGVERTTLWRWRQDAEFSAVVVEHQEAFNQEVRRRGLASRERRIKALNDRWNRMQRVIEERADDPSHADVPGWKTGLLVHDVKNVGGGENAYKVDLYSVDTGLLKELREHEKQAAEELGQWVQKQQVEQVTKAYIAVSPEDL